MDNSEAHNPSKEADRVSERLTARRDGRIIDGEERIVVKVRDLGLEGFGIESPRFFPEGGTVTLEDSGVTGVDSYLCRVVFCRAFQGGYQLGLQVLEHQEELVFGADDEVLE